MTPEQYCQDKTAKSGSSFYYSFLFLPKTKRLAITALYAFCREVDDIADAEMDNKIKLVKLEWWRSEIESLFSGSATHPVSHALIPAIKNFKLEKKYFLEIIDGMEMDLNEVRFANFEELNLYCYRVAGVVGLLSASIFGYKDPQTLEYAKKLGLALQLTNIIRDVYEDSLRNRLYLPLDELKEYGVTETQIFKRESTEAFHKLISFHAERAHKCYRDAFDALPVQDRYDQKTGTIMAAIYENTLNEMESDQLQVLNHKIAIPPLRKIIIALKTLFKEWWLYRKYKTT
ncbi:MAG: presqualene diphosphate synthase HpnD [Gammaproteobacteria bacterium]|nr:MAG: presqualene diphosphate synthase HpnD [Gammaproteobacteria bacterium]